MSNERNATKALRALINYASISEMPEIEHGPTCGCGLCSARKVIEEIDASTEAALRAFYAKKFSRTAGKFGSTDDIDVIERMNEWAETMATAADKTGKFDDVAYVDLIDWALEHICK